jgi:hypothetical protein
MNRRSLLPLVMLAVASAATAEDKPKTPADPDAIRKLVDQLGSDDFDTRENAVRRLLEVDEAALPALRQAAKGPDAELRRGAGELVATITARVEDRAVQKVLADINAVGLERFVERMAKDKDFATEERWNTVGAIVLALEKRASEVADRSFRITRLDLARMPTLRALPESTANTARFLLNNDSGYPMGLFNCVVISNGPLGRVGTFNNCVLIVNGDIDGFTSMRNCVVLCRGNIGRIRQIDSSIVLTTGTIGGAHTLHASLFEVASVGRCTKSINNVFLNMAQSPGFNSTDDRCLETKRGPLQMFQWTVPEPKAEKK